MARIAAVVPDLMLQSRVVEILAAAGHEVTVVADPAAIEGAELIVADVNEVAPGDVAGRGVPVLGFHQHTDPESKRAAEAAGVAIVVPRSRLVREMPELVERLLAEG
jgi:NAD(P)-dependent dehydrogenase (short-subunit alcohol dehydrogenase family)